MESFNPQKPKDMKPTYNDIVAENEALKKETQKLRLKLEAKDEWVAVWQDKFLDKKKELANLKTQHQVSIEIWRTFVQTNCPEYLDAFDSIINNELETPQTPEPRQVKAKSGCKVISINQ